jgi:hypothetical protein
MKLRPSPALVIAILALMVAMAGTSYAAVQIGSSQIKNNSVQGKDVKNGNLTGKDVKDGSLTPADLAAAGGRCAADAFRLGTGCLIKATRPLTSLNSALLDCNALGGRLPSMEEVKLLPLGNALAAGVTWTGGMLSMYEFTGEFVEQGGLKDVVTDFYGNLLFEDGSTLRGYHCVVNPS